MSPLSNLDLSPERLRGYLPYAAALTLVGYGLYTSYRYIFPHTVLQSLPGPTIGHIFFGNMREIFKAENGSAHKK
jgi:hypothetical protein